MTHVCFMVVQSGHSSCWTTNPAWEKGQDDSVLHFHRHISTPRERTHCSGKITWSRTPHKVTPADILFPIPSPCLPNLLPVNPYASLQCLSPGNADDAAFHTSSLKGTHAGCAPSVTPFIRTTQITCHTQGACDARMLPLKRRENSQLRAYSHS